MRERCFKDASPSECDPCVCFSWLVGHLCQLNLLLFPWNINLATEHVTNYMFLEEQILARKIFNSLGRARHDDSSSYWYFCLKQTLSRFYYFSTITCPEPSVVSYLFQCNVKGNWDFHFQLNFSNWLDIYFLLTDSRKLKGVSSLLRLVSFLSFR